MQKTVLLLLITFGTLFAKSYNFQETRYISALDKNIVLNGIIDFKKDSIKIEYKKQNKIVEYSNADIKLYQNGKEVELAKEQKSFMVQYFEILNLLHNNSEEILSDDFEIIQMGDEEALIPTGFLKNFIDEIDLKKRDGEFKNIRLILKNSDTVTINIYDEV